MIMIIYDFFIPKGTFLDFPFVPWEMENHFLACDNLSHTTFSFSHVQFSATILVGEARLNSRKSGHHFNTFINYYNILPKFPLYFTFSNLLLHQPLDGVDVFSLNVWKNLM